jgi:hypothetical protein
LKKRTKKFLLVWTGALRRLGTNVKKFFAEGRDEDGAQAHDKQKFFGSFFQKRTSSVLRLSSNT